MSIVACSTPPGISGIAVVRVSGKNSIKIASSFIKDSPFNKKTSLSRVCFLVDKDGISFVPYDTSNGLLSQNVRDLVIDNQGNKWIGTGSGMSVLNTTNTSKYQVGKYVSGLGTAGKIDGFVVSIIASNESSPPKGTGVIKNNSKARANVVKTDIPLSTYLVVPGHSTNNYRHIPEDWKNGIQDLRDLEGVAYILGQGSKPTGSHLLLVCQKELIREAESALLSAKQKKLKTNSTCKQPGSAKSHISRKRPAKVLERQQSSTSVAKAN